MRILTWNINGIRTIPQYHPWNTLKTHDAILDHLQADIINFQEVKSSRSAIPAPVALPPSYDAYYTFPLRKSGYSGVATYTRRPSSAAPGITALKAEEGLTSILQQPHLKPPLSDTERVSRPEAYDYESLDLDSSFDLKSLDSEGRVITLDFGLFVLINVYCPNDGSSEEDRTRFDFKMAFHRLLESRVRALIREGREVILLGDINACAAVIDHCEGDIIMRRGVSEGFEGEDYFWAENPARNWLKDLLEGEHRCLVDVVREFHPDRKGMFTCWNTKLSARASNYGTRIDYILVTPGLLPWIKAADIEPSIKGSDHCPVWIDLHEEIEVAVAVQNDKSEGETGKMTVRLRDVMMSSMQDGKDRDPPRLATRFWDEYSGKQRLLASFFNAGSATGKKKKSAAGTKQSSADGPSPDSASVSFCSPPGLALPSLTSAPSSSPQTSTPPRPSDQPCSPIATASVTPTLSPTPAAGLSASTSADSSDTVIAASITSLPSTSTTPGTTATEKRKLPSSSSSGAVQGKQKKQKREMEKRERSLKPGQSKLSSFFAAPSTAPSSVGIQGKKGTTNRKNDTASSDTKREVKSTKRQSNARPTNADASTGLVDLTGSDDDDVMTTSDPAATSAGVDVDARDGEDENDDDYRLAVRLSLSQASTSSSSPTSNAGAASQSQSQQAWKSLLKPPEPPRCTVHNEAAKEFRVNKPGVNKGRTFWVCARPVGPGYDKGRTERPREEVDNRWKCNFFLWSSEVKRERAKGAG